MVRRHAIAMISCLLLSATFLKAAENLKIHNPEESWGSKFAMLIHQFRKHRIPDPRDRTIIIALENYSFAGRSTDLNRFLRGIAELPARSKVIVTFTGPEGLGEPLTSAAAQAGVGYDWHVQVVQGDVRISIPLAARIPFSEISIPNTLKVESGPSAPRVASVFARLHNTAISRSNGDALHE